LPFLPLFDSVLAPFLIQCLNSSRFAGFAVADSRQDRGKSGNDRGKIAARNGKDVARWAAKTARLGGDAGASRRLRMRLRRDEVSMVAAIMRLCR
jgi:hypothetical protein